MGTGEAWRAESAVAEGTFHSSACYGNDKEQMSHGAAHTQCAATADCIFRQRLSVEPGIISEVYALS